MLELLKDYDCSIMYHPGKANVVADALSRKSAGSLAHIGVISRPLYRDVDQLFDLGLQWWVNRSGCLVAQFKVRSVFLDRVKAAQIHDPEL